MSCCFPCCFSTPVSSPVLSSAYGATHETDPRGKPELLTGSAGPESQPPMGDPTSPNIQSSSAHSTPIVTPKPRRSQAILPEFRTPVDHTPANSIERPSPALYLALGEEPASLNTSICSTSHLSEDPAQLKQKLEQAEQKIKSLKNDLAKQQLQRETVERTVKKLTEDNSDLSLRTSQAVHEQEEAQAHCTELNKFIEVREAEFQQVALLNQKQTTTIAAMQREIERLAHRMQSTDHQDAKLNTALLENQDLQQQNEQLKTELNGLHSQLKSVQRELETTKNRAKEIQADKESLELRCQLLITQIQEIPVLKMVLGRLRLELQKNEQEMNEQHGFWQQKLKSSENRNRALSTRNSQLIENLQAANVPGFGLTRSASFS